MIEAVGLIFDWLQMVLQSFIADPHPPNWAGSGGKQQYRFSALAAGSASLTFVYQ